MIVAMGEIEHEEEWTYTAQFYAFDIPLPGTTMYSLHHCTRSIHSAAASITRHRLTKDDPWTPWDFRFNIFVFPADIEDCTIINSS